MKKFLTKATKFVVSVGCIYGGLKLGGILGDKINGVINKLFEKE